jgi:hypothetical protein
MAPGEQVTSRAKGLIGYATLLDTAALSGLVDPHRGGFEPTGLRPR